MSGHDRQTVSANVTESGYVGGFTVAARPDSVAHIRHNVMRFAKLMPFSSEDMEDILLAVGEAASNAVRYGSPRGEENQVSVRCECCDGQFIVHISDEGYGFDPNIRRCQSSDSLVEGGRGLVIMRMLMDEVTFTFDSGTTVRLVKRPFSP